MGKGLLARIEKLLPQGYEGYELKRTHNQSSDEFYFRMNAHVSSFFPKGWSAFLKSCLEKQGIEVAKEKHRIIAFGEMRIFQGKLIERGNMPPSNSYSPPAEPYSVKLTNMRVGKLLQLPAGISQTLELEYSKKGGAITDIAMIEYSMLLPLLEAVKEYVEKFD